MNQRQWFRVEVKDGIADLFFFGIIGDWIDDLFEDAGWGFDSIVTAKKVKDEIESLPETAKTLRLHVNSPGGDVFGAVTIANLLREQRDRHGRKVEAVVEGLAASAASIIIQAGDPIRMADNALIMIHDPWTRAVGNAAELRKVVDELEKVKSGSLVATYQWHSELSEEEISALMSAETWMDADEAIANGFATEKIEGLKAAAALRPGDLKVLASIPEKYRARVESFIEDSKPKPDDGPQAAAPAEVLRLCREAGCLDVAEELVAGGAALEDVKARVEGEKKTRAEAAERDSAIRALCSKYELDALAAGYVEGGMSVDAVKAHITVLRAKLDKAEIDGGLDPDHGQAATAESWKNAFARASRRFGARA